ncbi:MAG: hypothetical protein KJN99_04040, partial [Marinicaulis sp.]|nr:hypothetical protein [Marinicaulis sp.]
MLDYANADAENSAFDVDSSAFRTFKRTAIAGRIVLHPAATENGWTLHGGASFRYRTKSDAGFDFRNRQRPATNIPGRIISTLRIGDSDVFTGIEFAALKDGFWTAAEYGVSLVNCSTCADDPVIGGGYIEAGWMIGGNRNLKGGRFDGPTISNKKIGTVAFVLRFDTIELNG